MGLESPPWGLGVVQRRSTTDQVRHELREAILGGRIRPGEPLPETTLARAMGTGRSAIREALRQLVQEGLVETEINRGARVRTITARDIIDVYRARSAIETAAVAALHERMPAPDLAPLTEVQARIRQASGTRETSAPSPELIAADLDFHRALVSLAGSPRLSRAHEPLAAESQFLLNWHPVYPSADYVADHEQLLSAVLEQDPRLGELVRAHLELTSSLLIHEAAHRTTEPKEEQVA